MIIKIWFPWKCRKKASIKIEAEVHCAGQSATFEDHKKTRRGTLDDITNENNEAKDATFCSKMSGENYLKLVTIEGYRRRWSSGCRTEKTFFLVQRKKNLNCWYSLEELDIKW